MYIHEDELSTLLPSPKIVEQHNSTEVQVCSCPCCPSYHHASSYIYPYKLCTCKNSGLLGAQSGALNTIKRIENMVGYFAGHQATA
jgi:hypothetical protein